jgi:hypothetical protein
VCTPVIETRGARAGGGGQRPARETAPSRAPKPKTPSPRLLPTDSYHYCTVPYSGEDAILFVGLAVVAACLLRGKLATTLLLAAGAALQGVLAPSMGITLGRLGNAVSWFLSIVPVR